MTEKALNNLSEYLCDTLTDEEKRDLALELSMSAMAKEELPPYTMEEINAMIRNGEEDIRAGRLYTSGEVFDRINKIGEPVMAAEIA